MSSSLYQEVILDHYHHPRHHGVLKNPTHKSDANNPLCGDHLAMQARVTSGTAREVVFTGDGCAISIAAASLLLDQVQGKKVTVIAQLAPQDVLDLIGLELTPNRVKCALLSLETLQKLFATKATAKTTKRKAQRRGR